MNLALSCSTHRRRRKRVTKEVKADSRMLLPGDPLSLAIDDTTICRDGSPIHTHGSRSEISLITYSAWRLAACSAAAHRRRIDRNGTPGSLASHPRVKRIVQRTRFARHRAHDTPPCGVPVIARSVRRAVGLLQVEAFNQRSTYNNTQRHLTMVKRNAFMSSSWLNVVEQGTDIELHHPVVSPTPFPGDGNRVMG